MKKFIASLQRQKQFLLKAQGQSMSPLLEPNDVLSFKKAAFPRIKVNDLILVKRNRQLFTHRIIYKTDKYLVTKGDNNPESDGKIAPKNILAKVVSVKRNGQIINVEQIYLLQSTLYFQEIVKIKSVFENEKIDFIFLKGLPLHLYFEKTHPKRVYADCDILINKQDFLKAEKIIKKFGYKKTDEKNKQVENNYFKVINGFSVVFDIHLEPAFLMTQFSGLEALYPQKLINKFSEELLNNKQQIKINDEKFSILNSQFLILYLALHLFHHNFRGAFRLELLDRIIRKNKLNSVSINQLIDTINNYRLKNFVYPVFVLLKKYYKTPISKFFLISIKSNGSVATDPYIKNVNIFDDEPRISAGINRFKNIFFLSPYPLWRKIFVFTNFEVIYTIIWIIFRRLSSSFSGRQSVR
ncbi:nucleotidyltransferase family protein [Candidatus Roizmanbacteria bacterium]|nr:nucleotidyltransferase family protein [Candidatus Roizmanbacteria bacterium]